MSTAYEDFTTEEQRRQDMHKNLRRLVLRAIGTDRTQATFAKEAGVSAEHLNRILNNPKLSPPSIATLKKIASAADNGVVLSDLLFACGYTLEDDKSNMYNRDEYHMRQGYSKTEQLRHTHIGDELMSCITEEMESSAKIHRYFENVWSFMVKAERRLPAGLISYSISGHEENTHKDVCNGDYYAVIRASWCTPNIDTICNFLIFYNTMQDGNILITDAAFSLKKLEPYGIIPESLVKNMKAHMKEGCHMDIVMICGCDKTTPEERLLNAIFGDGEDKAQTYESITEGIGFRVDDMDSKAFGSFLKEHERAYRFSASSYDDIYDKYVYGGGENIKEDIAEAAACVSRIMSAENNLPFWHCTQGDDENYVIVNTFETGSLRNEEIALNIVNRYAKELGIKKIGYYYCKQEYEKKRDAEYDVE